MGNWTIIDPRHYERDGCVIRLIVTCRWIIQHIEGQIVCIARTTAEVVKRCKSEITCGIIEDRDVTKLGTARLKIGQIITNIDVRPAQRQVARTVLGHSPCAAIIKSLRSVITAQNRQDDWRYVGGCRWVVRGSEGEIVCVVMACTETLKRGEHYLITYNRHIPKTRLAHHLEC